MSTDQPAGITLEMVAPLGALSNSSIFYSVTLLAGAIALVTLVCCAFPALRYRAKQGLFVGVVGGLLSLGLLSTFLMFQIIYFPSFILAFFCFGFVLFSGVYFTSRLINTALSARSNRHA